jgi:hypothetical protein
MRTIRSRGITGRVSLRFLRAWRGHRVGDVIAPPGGLRRELLRMTDQLGNKIAEEVVEPVALEEAAAPNSAALEEAEPRKRRHKSKE